MLNHRPNYALPASLAALAATAYLIAGPLNPPAGPVAPTYKTLTEVEPRTALTASNTPGDADSVLRITAPGSYYLTGDVAAPAGFSAIEILVTTGSVTIDLNGFRLQGAAAGAVVPGIDLGRANDVTIVNGSITAFMGQGVGGPNADNVRLQHLRITQCRETGARLGEGAIVEGCEFVANGLANAASSGGCYLGSAAVVTRCTFRSNTGNGLRVGEGAALRDCTARLNTAAGYSTLSGAAITGCTAQQNGANGFAAGPHSTVRDCASLANTGYGFGGGAVVTYEGCNARDNTTDGFSVGGNCSVTGCIASSNGRHGVAINVQATVTGCTITSNADDGINGGGRLCDNHVTYNANDGIDAPLLAAFISGNFCTSNGSSSGGANIRVAGQDSRVENNTCTGGGVGILVTQPNITILRNTCSDNTTNFSVVAGASLGTVFNIAGGIDISTSNSFANFEF